MSTSVASLTTNFFPSAENGFSTTTSGSVASGATTVGLASVAGYSNGEVVVFVIDPTDASKKQTFTGVMDTAGSQVTSVVWTAGTNQTHALGATVVDYATATHMSMVSKGILQQHKQSGAHSDVTADSIVVTDLTVNGDFTVGSSETAGGYLPLGDVPDTVTANGNRSYDLVFNGNDLTDTVSPGMRLKLTRTVTAPTGSITLNGSSQYASKTSPSGLSFTTTFSASAWVNMSAYQAGGIIARRNASTEGWSFGVNSNGQIEIGAFRIAANNRYNQSAQSIPLNKWVHVAATMDVSVAGSGSGAYNFYIDGVLVPSGTESLTGTCTALVQGTTALVVGCQQSAGANFFPGKIAQAAVYSAVLSAATIKASMNQTLTGSETNLVSAFKLDQASGLNDLSANANNLTANGSPSYSTTATPFTQDVTGTSVTAGTTNYAIITKASFSTNTTLTVQVPEGDTIPTSGGVSAVSYSTQKVPYGFPAQRGKWVVSSIQRAQYQQTTAASGTWYNVGSHYITVPVGEWDVVRQGSPGFSAGGTAPQIFYETLSTSSSAESDGSFTTQAYLSVSNTTLMVPHYRSRPLSATTATIYYVNQKWIGGSGTATLYNLETTGTDTSVELEPAYL